MRKKWYGKIERRRRCLRGDFFACENGGDCNRASGPSRDDGDGLRRKVWPVAGNDQKGLGGGGGGGETESR